MGQQQKTVDILKEYALPVNRIGMSLVFLWFGINQILDPYNFVGYLPQFLFDLSFAKWIVIGNGIFEILASILLILGIFVRPIALLLALHLIAITIELGYGQTAVRDFGLTIATIAIFLGGNDKWCLSTRFRKK